MGDGATGRWLDSDGRWRAGPPPEGWWQEGGGGDRWYPPALAHHPAARRPPGMPRPWAEDGEDFGAVDDAGDAPSDEAGEGEANPFPTLDLPWPDGDVDDDVVPLSDPDPSWSEPTPCRVPRRQVRPVHGRRSRHSFEPQDLSDADLDRLLRGISPDPDPAGGLPPTGAWSWPAWVKLALATGLLLVVVGVVGVLTAAGDTGDSPDTITTRGQSRPRPPSRPARQLPTTTAAVEPPASSPPPPQPTDAGSGSAQRLPPADPSGAAAALPDRAAAAAAAARPCHPSYEPCVLVPDDVDCADGQGNSPAYLDHPVDVTDPDVTGLDGDVDREACE